MFHIVDVDNTLVFTNQLIRPVMCTPWPKLGLEPRTVCDRITRRCGSLLVSQLTGRPELGVYHIPQAKLMCTHWNKTTLNLAMAHLLIAQGIRRCAFVDHTSIQNDCGCC